MHTTNGVYANLKVILRSLTPSPLGLLVTFLIGLGLVGGHLLLLSVRGTTYPHRLSDMLLQGYTNYIVAPLSAVVYSQATNAAISILLWVVFGLVLYELLARLITFLYEWRAAHKDITTPSEQVVRKHPLERYFLVRAAWRLLIVVATLAITLALLPVIYYCLSDGQKILDATSLLQLSRLVVTTLALWMLIMHCYVVLLRWYLLRTRVTEELLY